MPVSSQPQRVLDLLQRMSTEGLSAVKRLFWTELNYERSSEKLSTRDWPTSAQALLAAPPVVLAQTTEGHSTFDILYIPLSETHIGHGFPLSVTAERQIVELLLPNHPYALFLFSDADACHWHFVNVKYQREKTSAARQVFRRIAIGPHERLRTAAERLALLDLSTLSPTLTGLTPLAIQQRHDDAFDVEAVTKAFFTTYRECFEDAEAHITGIADANDLRLFTQRLFNRLLFIVFLERKGWLTFKGRGDYLQALWEAHNAERGSDGEANFYRDRLTLLFFSGLNNPGSVNISGIAAQGFLQERIGNVPYLNGGLFEKEALDERGEITVPDAVFAPLFDQLLYAYNFTVTESTPLDVEVAVDPEMLGKIFEELVTGRHESGSYYTPKPVVAFMCREALKGYLHDACPSESAAALAAFVEQRDARDLRQPEAALAALRRVKACDPACGSGAYLLGMLHELVELRQALFVSRQVDAASAYQRKLEMIQHNLYGVDLDPFAVNIARLRLWLSLIVDFDGETPPPLPNLEFKIEAGDSLTAPAPAPLQPDLFRQQDVARFFELKGQFMQAHGPEKTALRAEIGALKASIAAWASEESGAEAFDWAVDFAEVFTPQAESATLRGGMTGLLNTTAGQLQLAETTAPGFDIVVANPPYVRQELLGAELKTRLKKRYPAVYTGTADLYVYFYARALELLRQGGVASFITSNKWLRAGYGEKLRQRLNAATVQAIIDFGDLPVFGAIAYPQIIIFRNAPPPRAHAVRALTVDDLSAVDGLSEVVQTQAWEQPRESLRTDGWALVRPNILSLFEKIRLLGVPLGEYVQGKFYRGLTTGFNDAFVITSKERLEIVIQEPHSDDIIKPWLRGRDLKRWAVEWSDLYVIHVPWDFLPENHPVVFEHLSKFEEQLKSRPEAKQGRFPWYAMSRYAAQYVNDFVKAKIVYPDIAQRPEFAYDTTGAFGGNTMYIIPTDETYLLGILNSPVIHYYYSQISSTIQHGYLRFIATYMSRIPIPTPTAEQRAAVEGLVAQLLALHGAGALLPATQVTALEAELNARVYEVYGLTREEIKVVEGETQK